MGYYGLSMGSIFGIPLCAAVNFDCAALGLFGDENELTASLYQPLAAKIGCPVSYSMQLEDELFTRTGYLRVFDAIGSKDKRLRAYPGRHGEAPREDLEYIKDFLVGHLLKETKGGAKKEAKL